MKKDLYLKLIVVTVCLNVMFGIGAIGSNVYENPLHVGGCYWDGSAAIAQNTDPVAHQGGGETASDIVGELTNPTNSTGGILDVFTEGTESTLKTIQVAKDFLGGTYVIDVFQNITLGCDIVYDENEPAGWTGGTYHGWYLVPAGANNPVYDQVMELLSILVAIAVIITIIHIVRPGWQ